MCSSRGATSSSTTLLLHPVLFANSRLLGLKVPCSYELTAMGKLALLMHMSEFRLRVSSFGFYETQRLMNEARSSHLIYIYIYIYKYIYIYIHCYTLQHKATQSNTLQHTAQNCNTLQHTATQLFQRVLGRQSDCTHWN